MGDAEAAKLLPCPLGGQASKLLRGWCTAGVPEGITDIEENCSKWHYVVRYTCSARMAIERPGG
jgi:hypothetical protein